MAGKNSLKNLPNSNPTLVDFLKQPGQSAKPPAGGRVQSGGPPRNRRKGS
jgi:hypothetical protein